MEARQGSGDRPTAEELIVALGLSPLPDEGGFYRVTYESELTVPVGTNASRRCGSAIYYLITPEAFSALHRLRSPELFHFYLGDPLDMVQLHPDGSGRRLQIGNDIAAGERPQVLVPAHVWQGTCLREGGSYALLGTTMSPAFDQQEFELGRRDALSAVYPEFRAEIERLTR